MIGLAGFSGGKLWHVKQSNKQVARKLVEKSAAKLLFDTTVREICRDCDKPNEKNRLMYETSDGMQHEDVFDYVVICFPIYKENIHTFKLDFETAEKFRYVNMQLTVANFVFGTVKLFDGLPTDLRLQLFSVDPDIEYRSMAVQLPCDYSDKTDKDLFVKSSNKLYKVFSNRELDQATFEKLFERGFQVVRTYPWMAYPKYEETIDFKQLPGVVLDSDERSRVLYLNAIEWSSSCMELSCISARNISNLLAVREKALLKPKRRAFFSKKSHNVMHTIIVVTTIGLFINFIFGIFYRY